MSTFAMLPPASSIAAMIAECSVAAAVVVTLFSVVSTYGTIFSRTPVKTLYE